MKWKFLTVMIQYDREPNELFKARAKESIEGSSRMGNKGGPGMGNAEANGAHQMMTLVKIS
jgi:hypothetical protein